MGGLGSYLIIDFGRDIICVLYINQRLVNNFIIKPKIVGFWEVAVNQLFLIIK
jgi:hypothetical protein